MTSLFFYLALALSVSFLCSLLEAVLLSITPSYINQLEEQGHPQAARLWKLKSEIERPLAAILTLNTVSHTVGAAGVGAEALRLWGDASLAYTSAALTLLILVLSELLPKSLGAATWRTLAPKIAWPCQALVRLFYPFVRLSELLTRRLGPNQSMAVPREEIAAMLRLGGKLGSVQPTELKLIARLLRMRDMRTEAIMTPRPVVTSLPAETIVSDVIEVSEIMRFSRLPIWRDNPENIVGYVLKYDLLLAAARGQGSRPVSRYLRRITVVPELLPMLALLEAMVPRKEQIAMVVDEYGGFAGIVSTEDIVETLLGLQIADEVDATQSMRDIARGQWAARLAAQGLEADGITSQGDSRPPITR